VAGVPHLAIELLRFVFFSLWPPSNHPATSKTLLAPLFPFSHPADPVSKAKCVAMRIKIANVVKLRRRLIRRPAAVHPQEKPPAANSSHNPKDSGQSGQGNESTAALGDSSFINERNNWCCHFALRKRKAFSSASGRECPQPQYLF